jgi:hypothetical protein
LTGAGRRPASAPAAEGGEGWVRHLVAGLVLGALVLVCYANSLDAGFMLDNRLLILDDPRVRSTDPALLKPH